MSKLRTSVVATTATVALLGATLAMALPANAEQSNASPVATRAAKLKVPVKLDRSGVFGEGKKTTYSAGGYTKKKGVTVQFFASNSSNGPFTYRGSSKSATKRKAGTEPGYWVASPKIKWNVKKDIYVCAKVGSYTSNTIGHRGIRSIKASLPTSRGDFVATANCRDIPVF